MVQDSFCKSEFAGNVLVVRLEREKIGDYESPIIQKQVTDAATPAGWKVVIDLTAVRMVASAGLGAFLTINSSAKKNGGKLVLYGMDPAIKQVFELTKLTKLLAIVDTRDAALKAVG